MTIGLDLGISATKVVLMKGEKVYDVELWEGEFVPSKLNDYIKKSNSARNRVRRIVLTGVGSKSVHGHLCGIHTERVDEFMANGKSVRAMCQQERCIVVSIGSGVSFVMIDGEQTRHLGGSALGGGTLFRMFKMLLPGGGWGLMQTLSAKGALSQIDLTLGDVCRVDLPELPIDTTVVNFGKASQSSKPEDLAVGLVNLVVQNVGVMAYLAGKGYGIQDFVVIGRVAALPMVRTVLDRLSDLYGVRYVIPKQPEYMTAMGAALL